MLIRIVCILLISGSCVNIAVGQNEITQGQADITYYEAVEIALSRNINLRQQQNQVAFNQANKTFNYARYLPSVDIRGTLSQIDGQQFDQVQGVLAFTKSNRFNASLNANLTLFNGFNRINSIKQANLQYEAQKSFLERTEQQVIFNVSQQFLQILLDKELLRIAEENLENQNTTLTQIKATVEVGSRAITDQYTQEAAVQQVEVQRIRAENTFRVDKNILIQTLQLEPGVDINPQVPDWDIEEILVLEYDVDELYQTALENRKDYKQNELLLEVNQRGIQMASSGYWPTITAFFQYGSNFSSLVAETSFVPTNDFPLIGFVNGDPNQPVISNEPDFDRVTQEVPFENQFFDDNLVSVIGISFNIPIFDRFQTRISRAQAKLQYQNTQEDLKNLERIIYSDVQNAHLNFKAAKENYFATQKQYEAASTALELQTERYNLGIGNLVELSQANAAFVQAASGRAQAEYTLLFQKVILDYFVGTLKFEDI